MNLIELEKINSTQNYYEDILVKRLLSKADYIKIINFTSQTGTGKTKMMAEVINKMPKDFYFVITTLSKGKLHQQIKNEVKKFCSKTNYVVYGLNDYSKATILTKSKILSLLPLDKKIIWFRDEGHIHTNRWFEVLEQVSYKIVNYSATNFYNAQDDIVCNFNHTTMLRTLQQQQGTPAEALDCLLKVKKQHNKIKNYNPCAIFRILDDSKLDEVFKECEKRKLKYINITVDDYDMSDLCQDDNEYDVIINKFKIVEGIDIRRAHVLFMTNEPNNPNTTIQLIGRCRRNALLYRNDIDIFSKANEELLKNTRICYAFYSVSNMKIDQDINGNLVSAFCDTISVQQLKSNIHIKLDSGCLPNGLKVLEASGVSGEFDVVVDSKYGFNILSPLTSYYSEYKMSYVDVVCDRQLRQFSRKDIYTNWRYVKWWGKYVKNYDKALMHRVIDKKSIDTLIKTINKNKDKMMYLNKSYSSNGISLKGNILGFMEMFYADELIQGKDEVSLCDSFPLNINWNSNKIKSIVYPKSHRIVKNVEKYEKVNGKPFSISLWDAVKKFSLSLGEFYNTKTKSFMYEIYFVSDEFKSIMLTDLINNIQNNKYKTIEINNYEYYLVESKEIEFFNNETPVYKTKNPFTYYYDEYEFVFNNKELAILGGENFKFFKQKDQYKFVEEKNVTSKINKLTKLNTFISNKYSDILKLSSKFYFSRINDFNFDKKCNSMLGYCVEYCAKEILLNDLFRNKDIDEAFLIRTSIEEYAKMMYSAYRIDGRAVKTLSYEALKSPKYEQFRKTVYSLGKKTALFLKSYLKIKAFVKERTYPVLSVDKITALADLIYKDTIVDIKCTNSLTELHVKQILSYYYLSKYRDDLNIKKLLVYDAVSSKAIEINLETKKVNLIN